MNITRHILPVATALVFGSAAVWASPDADTPQLPAAETFVTAPMEIFPSIDSLTRLDMIDYYQAGIDHASKNLFNGHAKITKLTAEQITVETSKVAEKTINLIPRNGNDTIIMLITTVKTPAEDSTVKFYTRSWEPIEKGLFMVPDLNNWMTPEGENQREKLEDAIPNMLARITYEPNTQRLTLENNIGSYLPEEVKQWAGNSLHNQITFVWNGHKMVRE